SAARPECARLHTGAGSTPRPSPDTGPRGPRAPPRWPSGSAPGPHRDSMTKSFVSARRAACSPTPSCSLLVVLNQGQHLVVPQARPSPQIVELNQKGEAHNLALQPLHQLGRGGHGAAGGQQVV